MSKRKVWKAKTRKKLETTHDGYRVSPHPDSKTHIMLFLPSGDRYVCSDPDIAANVLDHLRAVLPTIRMPKLKAWSQKAVYYNHTVEFLRAKFPERLLDSQAC